MGIYAALIKLVGFTGGISIYLVAKAVTGITNINVGRQGLNAKTKNIMRPLFPDLDLERIRLRPGSTLPANWFGSRLKYIAITFGYTIYCTGKEMQSTNKNLNVIMHELVHTDQIRRRGNSETRFATDYGKGYLTAGNYRRNPLEEEAFDFVNLHRLYEGLS